MTLEVDTAEEVLEAGHDRSGPITSDTFVSTNNANTRIFEWSQHCWEEVERGPKDMVVDQDHGLGLDKRQSCADLAALVGLVAGDDTDGG